MPEHKKKKSLKNVQIKVDVNEAKPSPSVESSPAEFNQKSQVATFDELKILDMKYDKFSSSSSDSSESQMQKIAENFR